MTLRVAGTCSGVGGIELGFKQAGFEVVWANEFDKNANKTYTANFGSDHLDTRSIWAVNPREIPDHDVFVGGIPCQAFSHAGEKKGLDDERGVLFNAFARVISVKKPAAFLLENVKGLLTHDKGKTFTIIRSALEDSGYSVDYRLMNASEYGDVPQGRERIYVVGFRDGGEIEWPEPVALTVQVADLLEEPPAVKYFYDERYGETTRKILEAVTDDAVYSYRSYGGSYVRRNESGVCPTLMANMGSGGHNVPIVRDPQTGVPRRLTPRECFNLQGYPKDFVLPDIADGQLYKQAGNSVAVPVIWRVAEAIADRLSVQAVAA
jgi:DNA (cytosine-5)-methyltransferase 1